MRGRHLLPVTQDADESPPSGVGRRLRETTMCKAKTFLLLCRQSLFREQVVRFQHCEERRPSLEEVRQLWRRTGFRTA